MTDTKQLSPEERKKVLAAGAEYAIELIEQNVISIENFASAMIQHLGDKIRPWIKSFYSGIRYMPGYEHINFTSQEVVIKFDVHNFLRQAPETELLEEIQNQCSQFAEELFSLICKRAMRIINTWPVSTIPGAENYPKNFNTFDILSDQFQLIGISEITPHFDEAKDAVDKALSWAYDSLSIQEKFFIEYSECYFNEEALDAMEINQRMHDHFMDFLADHWSNSAKIQKFHKKRL